jgi:GTP-binding protein
MPVIAIVGRPNVGKSSLLNALSGRLISIVQDMPGVTRDRVSSPLEVDGRFVELVDTGGYGFDDEQGLSEHIKHQIEIAMSRADLVLFIVDCQDGLTTADRNIAQLLRKKSARTVLIANKDDGEKTHLVLGEFARLGLGTPVGVSAIQGRNLDRVIDAIRANVDLTDAPQRLPAPQMMTAIVGKRNAGKSTLVNAIATLYEDDPQRVIVSEVPGTTRDSVDVRFEKDGKTLIVIDTAGVRKKRQMVTHDIEFYSFHRAQRSIRRADVVIMLLDGTETISEPDKKLAQYIAEQYKPVVIVVNKWDLAMGYAREQQMAGKNNSPIRDEDLMSKFEKYVRHELRQLDYAPIAFVTAKDSKNVQTVLDLSQHLFKQSIVRVTTGRLNRAVKQIFEEKIPSTPGGKRVRVYYATQIQTAPPTIVLVVNKPEWVEEGYQRFMINRFRELLPYPEVPIKLLIRPRGQGAPPMPRELDDQRSSIKPVKRAPAARRPHQRTARRSR